MGPPPRSGNTQLPVAGEMLYEVDFDEPPATLVPARELEGPLPTVAVPGKSGLPASPTLYETYADDARQAIAAYEEELRGERDRERLGRLHFEIARLHEVALDDADRAKAHYRAALEAMPKYLPAVVGARRVLLRRGEYEAALELFDREIRVTADRSTKAALMFAKGRVLEDRLQRLADARRAYAAALDLAEGDRAVLEALGQADREMRAWDALSDVYARQANAVAADTRHRGALLARRARLTELHRGDPGGAAELYELALSVDPDAPGAVEALKRLHYERHRWRELIVVLEREAEGTEDPMVRIMALYRIGQIQAERLGNHQEAIAVLEQAAQERPQHIVVLEALVRLHEQSGDEVALAGALERLVECLEEPHEKLGYLHRIGELCRDALHDDDKAIRAYEAALAIDPAYIPALRALAPLYAARQQWDALVAMHEAEAEAVTDTGRRATAHARAAEILEKTGRWTEATTHHERALSLDPGAGASFRALVRLYTRAEAHHKLVELYERSLERVDVERRIEYLFRIGDLYRGPLDDPEQAEHAYRRILKLRPRHLGAVHALQRVAEAAGRHRELVEALELETQMLDDARETVALLHRAGEILHEELGDRAAAVSRFTRVLELDPHHAPTLASLGRIHHAEGHWADLAEVYARELEVEPDGAGAVALLHKLGEVHARYLADPEKAIECWRKALDLDPHYGPALQALARMLRDRGEWKALVELVELERDSYRDPQGRALAAFRAGEIYEEHLDDKAQAERRYAEALELRPGYRPAADALARVRTQLRHWKELATELEQSAARITDPRVVVRTLMRAAEIWSDHLGSDADAVAAYRKVLEMDPSNLGALLAIEPLYRRMGAWKELADTYARQVDVIRDPAARVAVQGERARVLELHFPEAEDDLVDCYTSILGVRPNDPVALAGLERLALRSDDPRVLASVDARLAAASADPELRASYLARQAEAMEKAGQPQALGVYRQALALDPHSRAALRGLARLAEVLGDGAAMAEAAAKEAAIAKNPEDAADAWVRSGVVHVDRLGDVERAIADFEKALAVWPDHLLAAEHLSDLLRDRGEFEVLVERLSRAADEARDPARQSALWIDVARIHAEELDNLGAALSALQRLTKAQPKNATALLELARLLASDRRDDEAIVLLERCVALAPEAPMLRDAHYLLATSLERSGDAKKAFGHYEKALALDPDDRRVLERVVDLQMNGELYSAAATTATRLLQLAKDDASRVGAFVIVAKAKAALGNLAEAVEALAEAVALEGPSGRAGSEIARLASTPEHWARYVEALQNHLRDRMPAGGARVALFLEIARTHQERLGNPKRALEVLAEGLRASEGDGTLRFELGKRLRQAGRHAEALEQFQSLLMDDVTRIEGWRHLAQTFEELGRPRERLMTIAALAIMDEASAAEVEEIRGWAPRTMALAPGALVPGAMADVLVAREHQEPAVQLLSAMSEGLSKLRPPDLSAYGVSSRDKLPPRSEHPLRVLVDHLTAVFGLEEFDVYLHRQHDRLVIENTSKPSLMLPLWVAELPRPQQTFVVSQLLVNLARGVYVIDLFTPRELEILLTAATRTVAPGFGEKVASASVLDDRQKLIAKGLPRRRRKAFEAAAEVYARSPGLDVGTFVQWARQSARRVALLTADDLVGSIAIVARLEDLSTKRGLALVRSSPVIADLLKVWVSKPAMHIRHRTGLLGTRSAAAPVPS